MHLKIWLIFIATTGLVCLTPGVAALLVVAQGISNGVRRSYWAIAGIALARNSRHPIEPGRPLDANHGLPLSPPQHSSAGPLEGQHPSGQRHGQRREAAAGGQPREPPARQGVEAARAPRIGGVMSAPGAPTPALGPCVSRIAGTARQRNEQIAH